MATRKPKADATATPEQKAATVRQGGSLPQDEASKKARHDRRYAWFMGEASRQASNRALMALCENFYDGEQYRYENAEEIRSRGQRPTVYNEIKPTIDWLIGTERRTRVDFVVVAQDEGEEAAEDARLKTKLMKYLDDTNRARFERSYAAEDAFKAGMGWIEVGLRGDKNGPPIYIGSESWRNMLWDSMANKRDLSDARYFFRIKVVDLDVAIAIFPEHASKLRECAQTGDDVQIYREWLNGAGLIDHLDVFGAGRDDQLDFLTPSPVDMFNTRERVLLLECWSREPVHNQEANEYGIADPVTFKMFCSVMTQRDTLIEAPSPFRHDRAPFIPVWAYRKRRTGLPYGPIWPLIGPQESLNTRMSRAIFEASSNQVKIEEDAFNPEVMDLDELRAELDDPNGIAVFRKGALSGGKVQERPGNQEARNQLEFASRDIQALRQTSGVTGENRGLDTNSQSGRAVLAKQEQGSMLTTELFDNLALARQLEGEMVLSLAEQFITQPMSVRTANDKNGFEYSRVNEWDAASGQYLNDITKRQAHFVVGEQAWKQTYAEAAFDSLMQVFTQLAPAAPQVVLAMLDILFEMHPNLPKKGAILDRIRSVTGQTSSDGKLTPEQQQAKAEQAARAKAEYDAQMAGLMADIKEKQARGEKLDAESMATKLQALRDAAEAAQILAAMPATTPIADQLLRSAGFKDADAPMVLDSMPTQQPQPQMAPPPQQTPTPMMEEAGATL